MNAEEVALAVLVAPREPWHNIVTLTGRRWDVSSLLDDVLPCRTCGARPDQPCRALTTGRRSPYPHAARWRDAQEVMRVLWPDADKDTRQ